MILQALTDYYRTLEEKGEISPPGWGKVKVSYALCIGADGTLEQVVSVETEQARGKKTVLAPQLMVLPVPVKRTVGIAANFLCDNAAYLLGVDNNGKPQRTLECFQACKALHEELLEGVDSPAARAVLAFFRTWQPEQAANHPALTVCWEELMAGGNLVFRYDNAFVHQDAPVRQAWDDHYQAVEDGPQMVCLVTGKKGPIARLHPSIKGIINGQAMGNSLVCFNDLADESYGCVKGQGRNAPTSKYAAFAYTTALNHLLADREHVYQMGDATVVCWARSGGDVYQNIFGAAFFGQGPAYTLTDLQGTLNNLCNGFAVDLDEERLDPNMDFYILGLSPNAARLSVRFFFRNTFGAFLRNAQAHQQRLEIVKPAYDTFDTIPMWKLLYETVNQNSRDKTPAPNMAGEVLRAVLTDTRYPATLLNGVALRIRAEHSMTRGRAAILKAYYLKNIHPDVPKEVLTVALNPDSTNIPYNLGRLFSLLEAVQSAANPGINTTIKDKYFNSASATPAIVFPVLVNLAQKHLKKLDGGLRTHYDKQITTLLSKLGESYPPRMNLPQQGCFQLGYYHQTQSRFEKKEEK